MNAQRNLIKFRALSDIVVGKIFQSSRTGLDYEMNTETMQCNHQIIQHLEKSKESKMKRK